MNSSPGVFELRFVLCSTKMLDYLDWVLRQKGFGAGFDIRHGYGHCRTCVDGLEENFLYKHSNCWICGQWVEARILKTCPQEIERAKGYKGPILELHFLMLEELVDSSSVLSMFFHVVLFDPFGFSRCCAQCQVVLEAGPNDLPWPDDAKSKEKGVTVCALCFGCREGWLFGWPSESQQGLSEGV